MSYRESALNNERLVCLKEVEALTSLKKSTLYALMNSGEFPAPVPVTPGRRAWATSEIQTWIAGRVASRTVKGGCHD